MHHQNTQYLYLTKRCRDTLKCIIFRLCIKLWTSRPGLLNTQVPLGCWVGLLCATALCHREGGGGWELRNCGATARSEFPEAFRAPPISNCRQTRHQFRPPISPHRRPEDFPTAPSLHGALIKVFPFIVTIKSSHRYSDWRFWSADIVFLFLFFC